MGSQLPFSKNVAFTGGSERVKREGEHPVPPDKNVSAHTRFTQIILVTGNSFQGNSCGADLIR